MSKRLTSEQIEAIQGYNILVLGQSCMGKSFLIQEIEKKKLKAEGNVLCLSSPSHSNLRSMLMTNQYYKMYFKIKKDMLIFFLG